MQCSSGVQAQFPAMLDEQIGNLVLLRATDLRLQRLHRAAEDAHHVHGLIGLNRMGGRQVVAVGVDRDGDAGAVDHVPAYSAAGIL